jgi:hypothetical protein
MQFRPTQSGPLSATLNVSASPGGATSATLTGTGGGSAALAISPPSQDFGTVALGSSSAIFTFTVTNTGGAPTGPLNGTITGLNGTQFTFGPGQSSSCTFTTILAAGATCTVEMVFRPTQSGPLSATLNVSASPGGATSATLTGTGASCTHQNGLGQTYNDCVNALGNPGVGASYNLTMAQEAAGAAAQLQGTISQGTCAGGFLAVVRSGPSGSAVWIYTGALAGYVRFEATGAFCPSTVDVTWN